MLIFKKKKAEQIEANKQYLFLYSSIRGQCLSEKKGKAPMSMLLLFIMFI